MLTEERIDCAVLDLRNECAHYMTELGCGEKEQCEKCYIPTALEALEKQIPKKPNISCNDDKDKLACCSICDSNIDWTYGGYWRKGNPNYCRKCGQKIDWSDE